MALRSARKDNASRQRRGFALLLVLCFLALLSVMMTRLMASSHAQVVITRGVIANVRLQAAINGALNAALYHATTDNPRLLWMPDGRVHYVDLGPITAAVTIRDERGKINPNLASEELLAALFQSLGVDFARARGLAAAIADWRGPEPIPRQFGAKLPQYRAAGLPYGPPGSLFQSLDELRYVLGMTPELLTALMPHLSLAAPNLPNPRLADPVVLAALHHFAERPSDIFGEPVALAVTASAALDDARLARRLIVKLNPQAPLGYTVVERDDNP